MSLGEIIRQQREQLGLTQDEVSAKAGISKPYLSNIETGRTKNPPTDKVLTGLERALGFEDRLLIRLAHLTRMPVDVREEYEALEAEVQRLRSALKEFSGEKAAKRKKTGRLLGPFSLQHSPASGVLVPVINKVSAGYPRHFADLDYPAGAANEYIRCPDLHDPQAFAARVISDSMEPQYHEGDVVILAPNIPAQSGDDCFVRFADDEGTTFKRFYMDDKQTIRLQPLNSKYPARSYPREQITGLWPAVFRIQKLKNSS